MQAAERRLLVIIDDAVSADGLPPLIAGLGPQVVTLITTQQGAEIRAEVERWLPTNAVMEADIHGLAPTEGRELVGAVVGRSLTDDEWELVQEIGELIGWHPEALRQTAIEGRTGGWSGVLGELSKIAEWGETVGMPWIETRRLVMRQWTRLHPDQREWLSALLQGTAPGAWFAIDEVARLWRVDMAVTDRRFWILKRCGVVAEEPCSPLVRPRWRVVPIVHQVSPQDRQ